MRRSKTRLKWALASCCAAVVILATPYFVGAGVAPYVRAAMAGEFQTPHYQTFYPLNTDHPDTPDQGDIILTNMDALAIVEPSYDNPSAIGWRGFTLSRLGTSLTLDAYFLYTGAYLGAVYGPADDVYALDRVPEGTYSLNIRSFLATDFGLSAPRNFGDFMADPAGYANTHHIQLQTIEENVTFTVVPEPIGLMLLPFSLFLFGSRRRRIC